MWRKFVCKLCFQQHTVLKFLSNRSNQPRICMLRRHLDGWLVGQFSIIILTWNSKKRNSYLRGILTGDLGMYLWAGIFYIFSNIELDFSSTNYKIKSIWGTFSRGGRNVEFHYYDWGFFHNIENGFLVDHNYHITTSKVPF
jgi:hypothetical protein